MQRVRTHARLIAALVAVISLSGLASAERPPECVGARTVVALQRDCTPAERQASSVTQPVEPKDRFVGALRQFLEAIAGQYGDERITGRAALDSMELALAEWDETIRSDEMASASEAQSADLHGALGLMYLDRRRIEDALHEFSLAARLDPKRADIQTFRGFAYNLIDKPAEAKAAFAAAAALNPGDSTTSYRLAQQLARMGQGAQAAKARQRFRETQRQNLAQGRGNRVASSPFIRVDLLRQAANVAPIFPPARYAEGFAALRQGRYRDAVSRFREAAAADPLNAPDAVSERRLEGSAALRQGQLTAALAHLGAATEAAPNVAETRRVLGMAYWADDRNEEAIEQLTAATQLQGDDERGRVALADVLVASGRFAEAEQVLQEAARAIPQSGHVRFNLGRLYEFQQKWSDAAQMFEAAANLNAIVGLDYLYQTIVRMHLSLPDFDRAIEAATKRISVNPNSADAHRALGDLFLRGGRHEEAMTELLAALLINPQDAESYSGVAQVHLRTGRYREAEEAARHALEIDPMHGAARYALATALIRVGRSGDGAKELERFQQLQAVAQLREQRELELKMFQQEVSASLAKDDYEGAIAALQKAISYEPSSPASYLNLGVVLKKSGRLREAIENFNKALELKDGPDVYRLLAEAYEALGQLEESQKHRETYERMKGDRLRTTGWMR